jgi:hypothetical protein
MNITNPVYTGMSDCGYYCHLTKTGVWLCDSTDITGVAITAFGIGVVIGATLMLVLCLLADKR